MLMATKKKWNMNVDPSVADAFEELVGDLPRGGKTLHQTAAVLMYVAAPAHVRKAFVRAIRDAQDEPSDVPLVQAAKRELLESGVQWPGGPGRQSDADDAA